MFHTVIQVWKDHLEETIAPLEKVVQIGLEIGDIEWVSYCSLNYCSILFFKGEQLETVNKKVGQNVDLMIKIKQETAIYCTTLWKQIVLNLQGISANKLDLNGQSFNEPVMLPLLEKTNNFLVLFYLYVGKGMLLYLFKDYEQSVENFRLATKYIGAVPGMIVVAGHNFYYSLALLALASNNPDYLNEVTENQEKMHKWATHAPSNFQHKYELVEAEKARILGQNEQAMDGYERAIIGANEQGYIQDEALANELAAEFHLSLKREKIAKTYMTDAYYGYISWGAIAKVKDLEIKYPQLIMRSTYMEESANSFVETIHSGTVNGTTTGTAYLLDLATVHKASLALSEEIVLNNLLEKMMKIVIENAGASQGYFITKPGNEWFLEVFGTIENQELSISTCLPLSDCKISSLMLPIALFNYVERTKTNLLLDNAIKDSRFATDTYISTNQPKSILCLPLIHSGKFTGILYLENNLIEGAFTSDRVKVLNLLSSQISIAIDNARLYTNLQNYSQELEANNVALQASETREREKAEQLEQYLHKLQQTQAQLVQTEKISSLGQLVAGVAHEVNNPVSFINGNLHHTNQYVQDLIRHLELYQETFPNPPENIIEDAEDIDLEYLLKDLPKMVSSMQLGTERIKDIMQSLRNFSRTDTAEKKPADIHAGIDSTVMILHHRLKATGNLKAINIVREYDKLPLVECYAGSLNQVFMNILANAIDAMEEERKISEKEIRISTQLVDDLAVIRIKDNGIGMSEEVRQKLFDAFFTTKVEGKGTGLGLSISHQIVTEKHGGTLTCTSAPGEGAEFAIAIPLH